MSELQTNKKGAGSAELSQLNGLGRFLEENRTPERLKMWRTVMLVVLGLLLVLNVVVPNEHPHFQYGGVYLDAIIGFWPVFGFAAGVAMIFLVKKIVQPIIKRPEDYYGDL